MNLKMVKEKKNQRYLGMKHLERFSNAALTVDNKNAASKLELWYS